MGRHFLTDVAVRKAKADPDGPYRIFDGDGLALWISPSGAKSWQLRYRLNGKHQTATLGKLDRMSLAEARAAADEARKLADQGEHLTRVKRAKKAKRKTDAENKFSLFATGWVAREARRNKWSAKHRKQVEASLANHLSALNDVPVAKITAAVTAPLLNDVELSAPLMLEKVKPRLRAILDYAVEQGAIAGNPLPVTRRTTGKKRKHFPAVVELAGLGQILRDARAADPCKGIQRAHLLLAFTALRVSEVVGAKWTEFELDGVDVPISETRTRFDKGAGNWSVPRERMKRKDEDRGPHVVPLPPMLLATVREWRKADPSDAVYVCPAPRNPKRHITPEAVEKHYRDSLGLGGRHSPHSWRSALTTISADAGRDGDIAELQQDRVVGNKVKSAYDRAKRVELRRELLKWYEETLIAARDGATVVPIKRRS